MKNLIALSLILLNSYSFGLTGLDLLSAKASAFEEIEVEFGVEHVEAWSAEIEGHEVLVKAKTHDELIVFGCHLHGQDMACHEEGHDHFKSDDHHSLIEEGFEAAMAKLAKTFSKRNLDFSVLTHLKVWVSEGHDDGHSHGGDVWTKVSYELNGKIKTTFIQCHGHGLEEELFCHYKSSANDEPSLEDGHDDHDHDHNH